MSSFGTNKPSSLAGNARSNAEHIAKTPIIKRITSIKRHPVSFKSNENLNVDLPNLCTSSSHSLLRKKDMAHLTPNSHCLQRPGSVFAEVSNINGRLKETPNLIGTPSINRKSLEDNLLTPKHTAISSSRNLNSSHPPLARSQTPSLTPNTLGRPAIKTNLPVSAPVTPKYNVRSSKPTTMQSSTKRRSSIKKSTSNLRSRVSVEDSKHEKLVATSNGHGLNDTPSSKSSNSYLNLKSNLRRVSSARKSSSYVNSPCMNRNISASNTPINSQQYTFLGPMGTPSDIFAELVLDEQVEESTTVSVGIRIRPINLRENSYPSMRNIIDVRGNEINVKCENGTLHSFSYDHCLWSCDKNHDNYASQEDVYQKMALPLLDHAYEGYNVCLFAYGQTGSGKSYCIMGEDNDFAIDPRGIPKEAGIIPRFCQDLFVRADGIHSTIGAQNVQNRVIVEISYIEIYNEKIFDLVGSQYSIHGEDGERNLNGHCYGWERRDALRVREHPETGPYVVGASWHLVDKYQDLLTWVTLGNNQRSIAATGMNDKSSRSHSVFAIKVTQIKKITVGDEETEHSLISIVNLVDLAGSERVAATHSDGDRLKEGVSINKSLLTLGKVITALAENAGKRKAFIPYRESVLTWLLKESLGGNSKTAMIATVSPCNIYQEETLSTLRFACQARKIVNWNHINEDPTSKTIIALKMEVERLRAQQLEFCNGHEGDDDADPKMSEAVYESEHLAEMEQAKLRGKEEFDAKERKILLLEDMLRKSQEQIQEKEKIWAEKFQESELKKNEALERCRLKGLVLKLEDNKPTLINLCEDPQLSETLLYSLKSGTTTLGQSNSDVVLPGLHNKDVHCSIVCKEKKLFLLPNNKTETYINGKLALDETEIFHNDRIILSGIYYFRVCFPTHKKKLDFLFARDEFLKAQEEKLFKEMSLQQESSRAEMLRELDDQRSHLSSENNALNENMKMLAAELEAERRQLIETEVDKRSLEEEKLFLEKLVKHSQRRISSVSESNSPVVENNFLEQLEAILNESTMAIESDSIKVNSDDVEVHFIVVEVNNICKVLKKPFEFQQQPQLTIQGLKPTVVVYDLEHNLTATITDVQLKNIHQLLNDILSGDQEDDSLFETSMLWERNDEVTKLPGVISRLKANAKRYSLNNSFNSSMACPLNVSLNASDIGNLQSSRKIGAPRRRSVLNQSISMSHNIVTNGSCAAKALSEVLLNQIAIEQRVPPYYNAISYLVRFQADIKSIINYNQQPNLKKVSDEALVKDLVQLGLTTQSVMQSLRNIAFLPSTKVSEMEKVDECPINVLCNSLTRKVARMLQGIDKEIDSLIEEEGTELMKLIDSACDHIAYQSVLSSESLVQNLSIIKGADICRSYFVGIGRGLEFQVKNASEVIKRITHNLENLVSECTILRLQYSQYLSKDACCTISQIADFLDEFSHLKVSLSLDEDKDNKVYQDESTQFLRRVESASDNIYQLTIATRSIFQEIKSICQGEFSNLNKLGTHVAKLKESLSQLIRDADIESAFLKEKADKVDPMINSSSSEKRELEIKTHLGLLANKALKSVKSLRYGLDELAHSVEKKTPKGEEINGPLKSSFKSGIKSLEEKKVRFNVSMGLSPENKCFKEKENL